MNITDLLLGKEASGSVSELARQFGITEEQARGAVASLAPTLARGMQQHTKQESGLDSLINALGRGNHSKYIDDPGVLGRTETVKDGNSILGHIFGSKEVSRNVATHASQETGIGSTVLKKMLPVVATMVMGSLGKKLLGGGNTAPARQQSAGILGSLLDSDKDGSIMDDVLGMAFKAAFR
ncbi:DUF937 domain-containing protein [Leucothrix sargassi]|nr:DUF937 domain-containing protein [Leucothrix sargassi]